MVCGPKQAWLISFYLALSVRYRSTLLTRPPAPSDSYRAGLFSTRCITAGNCVTRRKTMPAISLSARRRQHVNRSQPFLTPCLRILLTRKITGIVLYLAALVYNGVQGWRKKFPILLTLWKTMQPSCIGPITGQDCLSTGHLTACCPMFAGHAKG